MDPELDCRFNGPIVADGRQPPDCPSRSSSRTSKPRLHPGGTRENCTKWLWGRYIATAIRG